MTALALIGFVLLLMLSLYVSAAAVAAVIGELVFSGKVAFGGVFVVMASVLWCLTIYLCPFTISLSGAVK